MNNFKDSIRNVFKGGLKASSRFSISIFSAIAISLIAVLKIAGNFESSTMNYLLLDSFQLALLLTAVFSQASIAYAESQSENNKKSFQYANIASVLVGLITFMLLFFFGESKIIDEYQVVSTIAVARVIAATFVSAVAFVYFASYSKNIKSFIDSFFMTNRAVVISVFYGLVIMIGVSGVLGAFQSLVYKGMSYTVYEYLGVAVGLITYSLFLGYFPSFKEEEDLENIVSITEQPPFIYILLDNILVPIILALTVVLILWSVRVLFDGLDVSFEQLSSITTSYVIIGIWLHIMVAKHDSKLANFYKFIYPITALLVLAFEAWALFTRVSKYGFKTTEYSFTLIWIFAVISVILLIVLKNKAYRKIAITASVIAIVWVLPLIGYQDFTYRSQVSMLKTTLTENEMLVDDKIVITDKDIENEERYIITTSVDFIENSEKVNKPAWFKDKMYNNDDFKKTFGFDKTYSFDDVDTEYYWYSLILETSLLDISDYPVALAVNNPDLIGENQEFEYNGNSYSLQWKYEKNQMQRIILMENKVKIIDESLEKYFNDLLITYPRENNPERYVGLDAMSYVIEGSNVEMLLVFNSVEFSFDKNEKLESFFTGINGIYLNFK